MRAVGKKPGRAKKKCTVEGCRSVAEGKGGREGGKRGDKMRTNDRKEEEGPLFILGRNSLNRASSDAKSPPL